MGPVAREKVVKPPARRAQHVSDLVAYLVIPIAAVLTPAAFSRRLIRRVTRWRWLLSDASAAALKGARRHVKVPDDLAWKTRWKRVEMLDARDIWMMMCGRSRSVLAEIEFSGDLDIARNNIMVGMHWGPGASIIKLFAESGLKPALPYRPPETALRRTRPFFYLFSKLAARYMRSTMGERAVPVGGAGRVLKEFFDADGCIFVVSDAPPMEGRPTMAFRVLDAEARFDAGFPRLMAKRHREYVLFALNLAEDGSIRKRLELEGPFCADSAEEYLRGYTRFLHSHLNRDAPQWRIWHVENQLWPGDD
jgi:hypothetical protein